MAELEKYLPLLEAFEGGFADDPDDEGGATMKGITLAEYRSHFGEEKTVEDLKAITPAQYEQIVREDYWNKVQGDNIDDQQVAEAVCDFGFNSGTGTAVRHLQEVLDMGATGFFGPITLKRVNEAEAEVLCNAVCDARAAYVEHYAEVKPVAKKSLKGWLWRIDQLRYKPII